MGLDLGTSVSKLALCMYHKVLSSLRGKKHWLEVPKSLGYLRRRLRLVGEEGWGRCLIELVSFYQDDACDKR